MTDSNRGIFRRRTASDRSAGAADGFRDMLSRDDASAAEPVRVSRTPDDAPSAQVPAAKAARKESVLTDMFTMTGAVIDGDQDLKVEGTFMETRMRVHRLTIEPGGTVSGEITAHEIRSYGSMDGTIRAKHVYLYEGSKVTGDLQCDVLGVKPGSSVRARVDANVTEQIGAEPAPGHAAQAAQAVQGPSPFDPDFDQRSGGLRLVTGKA